MDAGRGLIMRRGIIGSRQSATTSEIVKRFDLVLGPTRMCQQRITKNPIFTFTFILLYTTLLRRKSTPQQKKIEKSTIKQQADN